MAYKPVNYYVIHKEFLDPVAEKRVGNSQIERDALAEGYLAGVKHSRKMVPARIRAELVCCSDEDIERMHDELVAAGFGPPPAGFHHICYWAEMAARLAEDFHSMMDSPYECDGIHPGPCWGGERCRRKKHETCERCAACMVCEPEECNCVKGTIE